MISRYQYRETLIAEVSNRYRSPRLHHFGVTIARHPDVRIAIPRTVVCGDARVGTLQHHGVIWMPRVVGPMSSFPGHKGEHRAQEANIILTPWWAQHVTSTRVASSEKLGISGVDGD